MICPIKINAIFASKLIVLFFINFTTKLLFSPVQLKMNNVHSITVYKAVQICKYNPKWNINLEMGNFNGLFNMKKNPQKLKFKKSIGENGTVIFL